MEGDLNQLDDMDVNEDIYINAAALFEHEAFEHSNPHVPINVNEPNTFLFGSNKIEFHPNSVSGLNECITDQARQLCIFDLFLKLEQSDHYDIGGTYSKENSHKKSDLWFYCTTSVCPDGNFILNIFVCHRNIGSFAMGISDTRIIRKKKVPGPHHHFSYLTLSNTLSWKMFKSSEIDESHHIKSFCFSREDLKLFHKKTLCIPIEININPTCTLDREIVWEIKRNHDLFSLFKRQEKTDFILESTSGEKYETHKLLLAAHSSVLRDMMKETRRNSLAVNINDDAMELLLEYMYTGSVRNIYESNCCQLMDMADQFKLYNLFKETESALSHQISVRNAIDIVILSEKYKLDEIQKKVFDFIKDNPEVLESDGWKNLSDVELTKKLLKHLFC